MKNYELVAKFVCKNMNSNSYIRLKDVKKDELKIREKVNNHV